MTGTIKRTAFRVGFIALGMALAVGTHAAQGFEPIQGGGGQRLGRGGPGGPFGPERGVLAGLMLERLSLTDAQKDQVKAILDAHRNDLQAVGQRMGTARRGMEGAIAADSVDETAIRTRAAEVAAVEADMAVLRARVRAEVVQILTADQLSALKDLRARARPHHERRPK